MAGVRGGLAHELAPPLVPLPYQLRVALEGFGRGEVGGVVASPQPGLGIAEGRNPALGGDAGTRERGEGSGTAQRLHESPRYWEGLRPAQGRLVTRRRRAAVLSGPRRSGPPAARPRPCRATSTRPWPALRPRSPPRTWPPRGRPA